MTVVERLINIQCEVTDRLTYYLCGRKPGKIVGSIVVCGP